MLQDKDSKKIQELQADVTPSRVSAYDIFSRFKALKLSECFSEFNFFKRRGYDFRMVLAVLVSMVVSPEKTVNSFLTSPTGEGSFIHGKRCVLSPKEQSLLITSAKSYRCVG